MRFDDLLEDYHTINPSIATVDDVTTQALLSGFISEEDQSRCNTHGSLSDTGDFFMAFESKMESEDYCMKLSEKLENVLNNPNQRESSGSVSDTVPIPQVIH